jgi:hypothetical protein
VSRLGRNSPVIAAPVSKSSIVAHQATPPASPPVALRVPLIDRRRDYKSRKATTGLAITWKRNPKGLRVRPVAREWCKRFESVTPHTLRRNRLYRDNENVPTTTIRNPGGGDGKRGRERDSQPISSKGLAVTQEGQGRWLKSMLSRGTSLKSGGVEVWAHPGTRFLENCDVCSDWRCDCCECCFGCD